jgi:hypothetical protein
MTAISFSALEGLFANIFHLNVEPDMESNSKEDNDKNIEMYLRLLEMYRNMVVDFLGIVLGKSTELLINAFSSEAVEEVLDKLIAENKEAKKSKPDDAE